MRITEHALRKVIREELTMSRLFEAETPEERVARLGNKDKRRRDFETSLKAAIEKGLSYSYNLVDPATLYVDYELVPGVPQATPFTLYVPIEDFDESTRGVNTYSLKLTFDPTGMAVKTYEKGLDDFNKNNVVNAIYAIFDNIKNIRDSDNAHRLADIKKGRVTVDIPGKKSAPSVASEPSVANEIKYTVQKDDILAAIVTKFYGLPYNSKLFPLYRLLSNYYMTPKRPNPNSIEPGDVLRLPAELKFNDGRKVPRKTGVG
jgi:hypothetical protein